MVKKDLYETLGVKKDATSDDIKKAFRKKAKKTHPDKGGNGDEFRDIVSAYNILSDGEKRTRYDNGENPDSLDPSGLNERQALSMIFGIFNAAIDQNHIDVDHNNIFEMIRQTIIKSQQSNRSEKNRIEGNVKRCENMIKRIKKNDKSEPYIQFLNQKVNEFGAVISQIDNNIQVCDDALELIKGCEYDFDPIKNYFFHSSSGKTTAG